MQSQDYDTQSEDKPEDSRLERLRVSKRDNETRDFALGAKLGSSWAVDEADYKQLERVAGLDARAGGDWPGSDPLRLIMEAMGEDFQDSETVQDVFGEESPPLALLDGFLQGAVTVFHSV